MLELLLLFCISFVIIFFLYEFFIVRKFYRYEEKKVKKKKKLKEYKYPVEVLFLINRYDLDVKKINYKKLLHIISLVSSFDISLILIIVSLVNNFYYKLIMIAILVVPTIFISYSFVGKLYKKKGDKNE